MRTRSRRSSVPRTKPCWCIILSCRLHLSAYYTASQVHAAFRSVPVHRRQTCRQSGGRLQQFTCSSGMKVLTMTNAHHASLSNNTRRQVTLIVARIKSARKIMDLPCRSQCRRRLATSPHIEAPAQGWHIDAGVLYHSAWNTCLAATTCRDGSVNLPVCHRVYSQRLRTWTARPTSRQTAQLLANQQAGTLPAVLPQL
jgi:hypothetical protein